MGHLSIAFAGDQLFEKARPFENIEPDISDFVAFDIDIDRFMTLHPGDLGQLYLCRSFLVFIAHASFVTLFLAGVFIRRSNISGGAPKVRRRLWTSGSEKPFSSRTVAIASTWGSSQGPQQP